MGLLPDFTVQNLTLTPNPVNVGEMLSIGVTIFDYLEPVWWYSAEVQAGEV